MPNSSANAFAFPSKRRLIAVVLAVAVVAGIGAGVRPAHAAEAPVDLGTAGAFGVLGGEEVTNTGLTVIGGDVGASPGTSIVGFPPGIASGVVDAPAAQAQLDLAAAYLDAEGRFPTTSGLTELGGQNLVPGVYSGGALTITGDLTLTGDANSVWIFQASSSLITASASRVMLSGPINPCNVFWQVDSSATLGTGSSMVGTVMALTSISADTGASVAGRLLARNGTTTLDANSVTGPLACTTAATAPPATAPPAAAVPGEATFTG